MMIVKIVELFIAVSFIILMMTQLIIPLWCDLPIFPWFRKSRDIKNITASTKENQQLPNNRQQPKQ
jgi:hypothetical protein